VGLNWVASCRGTNNGDNRALTALSADSSALLSALKFGHSRLIVAGQLCGKARLEKM
jgi:hypothetical protein